MNHSFRNSMITFLTLLALIFCPAGMTRVNAVAVVDVCDEAHLVSAITIGGTVSFSCDGTITLTSTITISSSSITTLDGVGHAITITNNGSTMFRVNSGKYFNLQNITLANGTGGDGVGVYNDGGNIIVTKVIFSGNTSSSYGAGIFSERGDTLVIDSQFNNNSADWGGGIYSYGGTLRVKNSTFSGNTAHSGGGIRTGSASAMAEHATVTITNSTFSANSVTYNSIGISAHGGAIFNDDYSTMRVINSTFSGNSAPATANNDGYPTASGIENTGSLTTKNTIFANSALANSHNCYNEGTRTDGGNNLDDHNSCGFNAPTSKVNSNPSLSALGNYGGNTPTFALLPGSPAIDAGSSTTCAAATGSPDYGAGGKDQRGVTRPSTCDIGAFESRGFTLGSLTGTPQSTHISTAFATPLGLSITSAFSEPVNGGKITFTPPISGASAAINGSPATIASGMVSVTATANSVGGCYNVTASAVGAVSENFALTNTPILLYLPIVSK